MLDHENHATTQQVYDHYPENMRLTIDEKAVAEKMIKAGGNKKLIKSFLENERQNEVAVTSLHNLQTKLNKAAQGPSENPLENLHVALSNVPNARIRFIDNQSDELIGK